MNIESLKKEHIPELVKTEKLCFGKSAWKYEGFLSETESESSMFFCALRNGEVLGCIAANDALGQGFISKVMVSPEHRREGIADSLLNYLESEALKRKMFELTLEVRCSNTPAVKLYEKHGFKKIGTRRRFYHDPEEDALIMTKKL